MNLINGLRQAGLLKILFTRDIHESVQNDLKKRYDTTIYTGKTPMPRKSLISKISDADGLVCFPYDVIDRKVIDAADNLKVISTYSVGYDHIDVAYAKSKGIKIGYTPYVLTNATADLAIALMLDVLRRVTEGDRMIREGRWREIHGAHEYVGTEVAGKTLGILGMGRIGSQVAKRAKAFGMNVIYHNRHKSSKTVKHVSFESLLKRSDVLSVHVPYTKQTDGLIDITCMKKMKKTAFIINTSRGKVIKESDLVFALKNNIIAGAALDVFESEPIGKNNKLTKMQNVVLAPHIGSSTMQARSDMAQITAKNLIRGLSGKNPVYYVR